MSKADPEAWTPPNYPLAPEEAENFLHQLQSLNGGDLETLRHMAGSESIGAQLGELEERQALARFMGIEEKVSPWEMLRRHGQRILIWLWHMEDLAVQLSELEARCHKAEAILDHNFSEADCAPLPRTAAKTQPPDLWQVCILHAALFIPLEIPIFMEGAMREEMMEEFTFAPMPQWGDNVIGIRASVQEALKRSLPPCPGGAHIHTGKRLWLTCR